MQFYAYICTWVGVVPIVGLSQKRTEKPIHLKKGDLTLDECHTHPSHLHALWRMRGPANGTENSSTDHAILQNRADRKTAETNFCLLYKVVLPIRYKTGCSIKDQAIRVTALPQKGAWHQGDSAQTAMGELGCWERKVLCSLIFQLRLTGLTAMLGIRDLRAPFLCLIFFLYFSIAHLPKIFR